MNRLFPFILIVLIAFACGEKKQPLQGETPFQKELNAKFKDATVSPLTDKDRKAFKGLDFFKFDSTFIVKAHLKQTPDTDWFNMQTTTNRVSKERVFGVLSFLLQGKEYRLNIYQGADNMLKAGYEDYLFLPFLDETNGEESYGGGRYIDLRIPEGDSLEIDFNKAYNPYCAYNPSYSCPIVPRENYLRIRVEAGVKAFKKH
ncbi:DUF1684 domain-containing protein [Snuella sedimenti]|uniref:DUF1684 domain-containing protein n=1 Tax=Snuella sedimenti TaxID=2798802 RepID=A0A8J7LMX6_9FLAO|nr:DUF1684 domain-containing protein [Snuella sedimenti]MBJ6367183.1 DUF1684 domain-containing protein [Snuella sedimenti]